MKLKILFFSYLLITMHTSCAMDLVSDPMHLEQDPIRDIAQDICSFCDDNFIAPCVLEKVLNFKINQIFVVTPAEKIDRSLSILAQVLNRELQERGKTLCSLVNRSNATVLHWAASSGHRAVVNLLLDVADDNVEKLLMLEDRDRKTALHWAARWGHTTIAKFLLIAAGNRKNRLLMNQHFIALGGKNETIDLLEDIQDAFDCCDYQRVQELLRLEIKELS